MVASSSDLGFLTRRYRIRSVGYRRILNSHAQFTNEFVIKFEDGTSGYGSAPLGETRSIYEEEAKQDPDALIWTLEREACLATEFDQASFDEYLRRRVNVFGRSNCYALSLAFFCAATREEGLTVALPVERAHFPKLCLNILNGGRHAYTNPVLSDFHEYLLVSASHDLEETINNHHQIQLKVKEGLRSLEKEVVHGNVVNVFKSRDNRACFDFLLDIVERLGLGQKFDLMVDASAGSLWSGTRYNLDIADKSQKTSNEMADYWLQLIKDYNLGFLEDPFYEKDLDSWQGLVRAQNTCCVLGDNLYSSDDLRIREGAERQYTNGVVVKPDQAGTVSGAMRAVVSAQLANQAVITSHRSISTESTFLSFLTWWYGVEYIKVGPLADYSSIMRINELVRLASLTNAQSHNYRHP